MIPLRPMTPEEMETAGRIPRVRSLRHALALTRKCLRRAIIFSLGTLRDGEQGRSRLDQRAEGATLKELAESYDVGLATISRLG